MLSKFQVVRGAVSRPHAAILTGRSGIGKTYLTSTIPGRFFICVEQGLSGAAPDLIEEIPRFDTQPKSLGEFFEMLAAFKGIARADGYRHLVVDSLSGIEALVHKQACGSEQVAHMEAKDFKKVWSAAMPLWQRVQRELDAVRDVGRAHIWLIAHAQETTEVVETGDTFAKFDLAFQGAGKVLAEVRQLWRAWADHVFFLDWQATVRAGRSIGQKAVGEYRSRVLWTRETPRVFAKSRSAVPDKLPATWADLKKALEGSAPTSEQKMRAQIAGLAAQLEQAERALVEADLRSAKTPAALAAVLSRAQGFVSVRQLDDGVPDAPDLVAEEADAPLPPEEPGEAAAPAPAPAPAPKPTPAEGAALAARAFPSLKPQVDAIAADPTLSDDDKHTAIKSLVRLEKARAAGAAPAAAAQPQDPKVVAEVRRLLLAADHADPGERAEVAAILREYSRGSGRIEDVSAADMPKLVSELAALLNGSAVAA